MVTVTDQRQGFDHRCELIERNRFLTRMYGCGHRGPREFRVIVYGRETEWVNQLDECPECFIEDARNKIIFCALCGLPIFPGEGVVLYNAGANLPFANTATRATADQFMGCLRFTCDPRGAFAGNWTGERFKPLTERLDIVSKPL